jgi:hypothetical protein
MIEKLDVGVDLDRAAVEPEAQVDLRLVRGSFDGGSALTQACTSAARPLRPAIGTSG